MEVTVSTILADVGTFFTEALKWVGKALETIEAEPILLIAIICVPLAGIALGYIRRLFSLSA